MIYHWFKWKITCYWKHLWSVIVNWCVFEQTCSLSNPIQNCDMFCLITEALSVCVCVQVKLWRLCDPELQQPSSPVLTLRPGHGRLELVAFHPTSSGLLAVGATKSPLLWDTSRQDAPLAGSYSWGHVRQMFVCLCAQQTWINLSKSCLYIMHCLLRLTFQSLSVSLQFLLCFYVQHECICNWSGWFPFFVGCCLTDTAYVLQPCGSVYVPEQQR